MLILEVGTRYSRGSGSLMGRARAYCGGSGRLVIHRRKRKARSLDCWGPKSAVRTMMAATVTPAAARTAPIIECASHKAATVIGEITTPVEMAALA